MPRKVPSSREENNISRLAVTVVKSIVLGQCDRNYEILSILGSIAILSLVFPFLSFITFPRPIYLNVTLNKFLLRVSPRLRIYLDNSTDPPPSLSRVHSIYPSASLFIASQSFLPTNLSIQFLVGSHYGSRHNQKRVQS